MVVIESGIVSAHRSIRMFVPTPRHFHGVIPVIQDSSAILVNHHVPCAHVPMKVIPLVVRYFESLNERK